MGPYTDKDFLMLFLNHNQIYTTGVKKVLQIDIQKIHKALEFDFI